MGNPKSLDEIFELAYQHIKQLTPYAEATGAAHTYEWDWLKDQVAEFFPDRAMAFQSQVPATNRDLICMLRDFTEMDSAESSPVQPVEPEDDPPGEFSFSDLDAEILLALRDVYPRRVMQLEIIKATRKSRGTIKPRLDDLRDHGLIERPAGERGGEQITKAGLAAISALFPQSK